MKALGSWQRKAILEHCVEQFKKRKDELAMALCIEAGKPIKARLWLLSMRQVCIC